VLSAAEQDLLGRALKFLVNIKGPTLCHARPARGVYARGAS
jgi:hypothetical protein